MRPHSKRQRRPTLCHPEAPKNEGVILGAWMTLSRGATFDLRAQKARRWIAFSATRWQRNRGSAAHLFPSSSEKPIHPRILIFNLLHKTSLAAERGSMGAVEGPPTSCGFSSGAHLAHGRHFAGTPIFDDGRTNSARQQLRAETRRILEVLRLRPCFPAPLRMTRRLSYGARALCGTCRRSRNGHRNCIARTGAHLP